MKAFLDTHVAVLLCEGKPELLGTKAKDLIERAALFVSPVVRLELAFLAEIGRIQAEPDYVLAGLATDLGVSVADDPMAAVIARSMGLGWTRDPFDRLLVATAMLHRAPFVTSDRRIHEHYDRAVW